MLPFESSAMQVTVSLPALPNRRAHSRLPEEVDLVKNMSWPPALVNDVPPKLAVSANHPAVKTLPDLSTPIARPPSLLPPPKLVTQGPEVTALFTMTDTAAERAELPAAS